MVCYNYSPVAHYKFKQCSPGESTPSADLSIGTYIHLFAVTKMIPREERRSKAYLRQEVPEIRCAQHSDLH